jgi:hypothetical protein
VVEALLRSSPRWWAELEDRGLPPAPWRPFHVHPNDLYQVQRRSHTHTWVNLAKLVHPAEARWEDLLDRDADPELGGLVYQIERSAFPAKRSSGGRGPSMERTEWLVAEIMPTLRQTAGTLLIHGFGSGRVWNESADALINAFLGYESGTPTKVEWQSVTSQWGDWLWYQVNGDHRVVWSRALGWYWRDEYRMAVRSAMGIPK